MWGNEMYDLMIDHLYGSAPSRCLIEQTQKREKKRVVPFSFFSFFLGFFLFWFRV